MTPQHYLTAAPSQGWREIETGSNLLAAGWICLIAQPGIKPRTTNGNARETIKAAEEDATPERFEPYQFDSCSYLAAESNYWLDREYWSEPVKATIEETPLPTGDAIAIYHDLDDRPRVDLRTWGQPATATTTQTALKWRVGAGWIVQPPEFAPPHFLPVWLDIAFVGWTWEKIAGTHKP